MENKVAISTLPFAFESLGEQSSKLKLTGANFLHCDIMDGVFVSQKTYMPASVAQLLKMSSLPLDVHLMIETPTEYLPLCAGAYSVSVHCEVFNLAEDGVGALKTIKTLGAKAGIAIDLYTPLEEVLAYVNVADYVLVMSVKAGKGGQVFDERALQKVRELVAYRTANGLSFKIEIDGGINGQNAQICVDAGVDVLVSGSYVANSDDYSKSIASLKFEARD